MNRSFGWIVGLIFLGSNSSGTDLRLQNLVAQFNVDHATPAGRFDFAMGAANVVEVKLAAKQGKLPDLKDHRLILNSTDFATQSESVYMIETPGADELVVFLPGLASDHEDAYGRFFAQLSLDQKKSFAFLPAPFSTEYLSQKPKFPAGDFVNEARIALDAIRAIVAHLHGIRKVHLVGFSYGAFMAALVAAGSAESDGVINGQVVLMSLPKSMGDVKRQLDQILDHTMRPYQNFNLADAFRVMLWNDQFRSINQIDLQLYAEKIFGWAFVRDLTAAALDLNNRFGCDWPAMAVAGYASRTSTPHRFVVEDLPFADQEFRFLLYQMSFDHVLVRCTPANLTIYSQHFDETEPWLVRAQRGPRAPHQILVLNSLSDPVNSADYWAHQTVVDSYLISAGGHNGYLYGSWMKEFFAAGIR